MTRASTSASHLRAGVCVIHDETPVKLLWLETHESDREIWQVETLFVNPPVLQIRAFLKGRKYGGIHGRQSFTT